MEQELKKREMLKVGDPLFEYVTSALRFALNFSHGITKEPSLTQLMGGGKSGKALGGLDGAAQAGMLQSQLERLNPVRKAILVARYAPASVPCSCARSCCRGYRRNLDWNLSINYIAETLLRIPELVGEVGHFHLRRAMVEKYFGQRVSFVEMAKACHISRNTASQQHKKVVEFLKKEERFARWEFEGQMKEGGVIP